MRPAQEVHQRFAGWRTPREGTTKQVLGFLPRSRRAAKVAARLGALLQDPVEQSSHGLSVPEQASCYLYGYLRETEARAEAELALGRGFRVRHYHDFLLSQGLLPFPWRRERMLAEHVAGSRRPLAA